MKISNFLLLILLLPILMPGYKIKWKRKFRDQCSTPVITQEGNICISSGDYINLFSPKGKRKWKRKIVDDNSIVQRRPITGANGTIYLEDPQHLIDNYIHPIFTELLAVNPEGKIEWSYSPPSQDDEIQIEYSSVVPAPDGGVYYRSVTGLYISLSPDGEIRNIFPREWEDSKKLDFRENTALAISNNNRMYAVMPTNQAFDSLYMDSSTSLFCFDSLLNIDWYCQLSDLPLEIFQSPIINHEGNIFIYCTEKPVISGPLFGGHCNTPDGYIFCVSPEGQLIWRSKTLNDQDPIDLEELTYEEILKKIDFLTYNHTYAFYPGFNDVVYLGVQHLNLTVLAIDSSSNVLWKYETPYSGASASLHLFQAQDSSLYVAVQTLWETGYLYALTPDGELMWELAGNRFFTEPVIGEDGTLYTTDKDFLYAIEP
ncbi:hypothetical protein GF359_04155 [candidate division WOR-3 bacterium]|uniref:Pyrrolo-quinoline quinone n=1 Tax=candidate division WOR-3 bacterium TaxID=2052148 RepID=A0A9D5QCV5_UNCW3|nr:hypothetical protein [candidate division WOR-3 bacterium]MBD3364391.1 hypothetical protein [candidate division WOR-3 bacterium]